MNRMKFLGYSAAAVMAGGSIFYLNSDKSNFVRWNILPDEKDKIHFQPDEKEILHLASLAPSGHNAQPWFIQYLEPYRWIIGIEKSRWLPVVDPFQRETLLSMGAFIQNLEFAAHSRGYKANFIPLAQSPQDREIMKVELVKKNSIPRFDEQKILLRTTLRSPYFAIPIKKEDIDFLLEGDLDHLHFFPRSTNEYAFINQETIEANKIQINDDPAEKELSDWIRFSSREVEKNRDGLSVADMDIDGFPGWWLRNFYGKKKVMEKSFRDQSLKKVITQVSNSGAWILITSKEGSVNSLIDSGRKMQRLFLKIREKGIAMHPMSQILEESPFNKSLKYQFGLSGDIQFILRLGYINHYPEPVSLRRPVDWFTHKV